MKRKNHGTLAVFEKYSRNWCLKRSACHPERSEGSPRCTQAGSSSKKHPQDDNIAKRFVRTTKVQIQIGGFTLIEMMLVLVIIAMILYASIGYMQQRAAQARIDRTSLQMQQILNAGLAYYVANGSWPTNLSNLQNGYYLPPTSVTFVNPWGNDYQITTGPQQGGNPPSPGSAPPMFFAYTQITTTAGGGSNIAATAQAIAGLLPLAYTTESAPSNNAPPAAGTPCTASSTTCYIVASVNIPGQNLNNARGVNFAGLYHHGACVPVPQCPVDATGQTMIPQIFVVPVQLAGVNHPPSDATANQNAPTVFPIESFTAYAMMPSPNPSPCEPSGVAPDCNSNYIGNPPPPNQTYWRVCAQVTTTAGDVAYNQNDIRSSLYGQDFTLLAFTRCAVDNEPSGSNFQVFSN